MNGIKEELMGLTRPVEENRKPIERTKDLGGTSDQETASLVDEFQGVFEELPPIGVIERIKLN